MGKKTTKKYYLPIDFPTPHIQDDPNMPYMKFEDGGNGFDQNEETQKKQKGANFMQGMQSFTQSGGIGSTIATGIDEKTTDERGYQDTNTGAFSGYLKGTSKGAQMGSAFGPWGMLIGAAVGGTYGGITGYTGTKKRNKAIGEAIQEQNADLPIGQVANPYARALGGPLPEMEGYNTYKGNTHENGGIPAGPNAEVENGEVNYKDYIYSDRLTPVGKNSTFASLAKRVRTKYKGREEDKAAKIAMDQELAKLAQENDAVREAKQRTEQTNQTTQELQDIYKYGGCIKYENGGLVLDETDHNKLRRVAKKRGIELNELLTSIYANTQKFALGGYNDFSNQYNKETDENLTNHYQDGGPNQKRTPAEWDAYNTERGWTVDPRYKGNASGYKPYFDPRALKIKPSTTHESGYEIEGVAPDAYNFGMVSPKYHANYEYKAPVKPMTIGTGTPKVLPTSNREAIGFDTMGTTYKDKTTGEIYMLDKQGNKIQPLTKAYGGPIDDKNKLGDTIIPNEYPSPATSAKLPFLNGDISDAEYRKYLSNKKKHYSAISKSGLTEKEYYEKYPNATEWMKSHINNLDPKTFMNAKEFGGGGNKKNSWKNDPNLSKYSKEDLKAMGYDVDEKDNSDKFKFGNEEGALLASSLPAIYQLIKGSKPAITKFDKVKPEQINLSSQRKGITQEGDRAKKTALEIARSVGGGSGSVLAALSAMNSRISQQVMDKLSDSYSNEALQNIGIRNQAAYTNTNISMQEKIANEQNKAMSDSLIAQSLSNLGINAQMYSRDKKLSKTNKEQNENQLNVMNQMFPNFKWGEDPNSDKLMVQFLSGMGQKGGE